MIGDGRAGEEAPSCEGGVHMRTCRCTPYLTCISLSSNGSLATHQVWTQSTQPFARYEKGACTCARADALHLRHVFVFLYLHRWPLHINGLFFGHLQTPLNSIHIHTHMQHTSTAKQRLVQGKVDIDISIVEKWAVRQARARLKHWPNLYIKVRFPWLFLGWGREIWFDWRVVRGRMLWLKWISDANDGGFWLAIILCKTLI